MIPGKVEFIVELRNPTMEPMDQVIDSVLKEHPELVGEEYIRQSPTQCSSKLIKLSETLCRNSGIRFRRMFQRCRTRSDELGESGSLHASVHSQQRRD